MTQPRCILPGATYLITRRTIRRHFLFRPDDAMNNLFRYCLAVTAEKHGVEVHAAVLMSTHEHLVLSDPRGILPIFLQEFHRLVALGTKVLRKWEGPVWDHERPSVVELRTPEAVFEKIAYALVNPVAAGLVRSADEWPGVTVPVEGLGRATWQAERPDVYFDPESPRWPPTAELKLTLPACLSRDHTDAEVRSRIAAEIEAQQDEARKEVGSKGWSFAGRKAVLSADVYRRATSYEPLRSLNPNFAVGRNNGAAFREAVRALRAFRNAYREALESWRVGLREVMFPTGTWCMCRMHHVPVTA